MSGGKPGQFPAFNTFGVTNPFLPLPLFDPFGFTTDLSEEEKATKLLREVQNGRLAMIGLFSLISEARVPGAVPALAGLIKPYDGEYNPELEAEYNIHQPEIRVNVVGETELYESDQSVGSTEEDLVDAELYKGRGQKARGHMASVIWEDFDPQVIEESQHESMIIQLNDGNKQSYGFAPPFYWIDGDHPKLI